MYLGDNLLRDGISALVSAFRSSEPDALILLTHVSDPSAYGVAELDGDRVVHLVEKPSEPPSDLALVGVYMFQPAILAAARKLRPSWRGELEITEAIQALIDDGARVESCRSSPGGGRTPAISKTCSRPTGWCWRRSSRGWTGRRSTRRSRVGSWSRRSAGRAIERARAGDHRVRARITDTYIGPYTSVGEGVEIACREVEHSIILSGSRVSDLGARMEASLLGRNVRLERSDGPPQTLRLLVGDNSEIAIV